MSRLILLLLVAFPLVSHARVEVRDDAGRLVILENPAVRIVSLAPNITEMLFAAGAGAKIVGAVEHSDYPKTALVLPRVGDAGALDVERIVDLRPDLVVAWKSGNPSGQIEKLESLGISVFYLEARHLPDIEEDLNRLGVLAGTQIQAQHASARFRNMLEDLTRTYAGKSKVSVFYEVWPRPLMTVSDKHIISDVIRLCGARNVFGSLKPLAPTVSLEAVIAANPQVIVSSGPPKWLDAWRQWRIAASEKGNLFSIPPDLISRPGPRILEGAKQLCSQIQAARIK